MNGRQFTWLFFGFAGRVSRSAYALAGLFLLIVQFFLLYRFALVPEGTPASDFWATSLFVASGIALMSNLSLAAKRLHDFNRSGWFALLFLVAGILMYLFLCFMPGDPGPNRYGERTNAEG